jgi:uncharacterized protein YjiS (DUF1127 family)
MSDRVLTGLAPIFTGAALRSRLPAARHALALGMRAVVTRRDLALLDERALNDIGVTHAEALAESQRAPWDLEPRRKRPAVPKPSQADALWGTLREMLRRYRSRRDIASMDERALKDIGVSIAEAETEANKPFWRA